MEPQAKIIVNPGSPDEYNPSVYYAS